MKKDQDLAYQSIKDKINKENNDIFAKAKEQSDEFKKISDNNIKLNQELAAQGGGDLQENRRVRKAAQGEGPRHQGL